MKKFILALGALLFISNWGCQKNEQPENMQNANRPAIEAFAKELQADFKGNKAIFQDLLDLYSQTKTEEFTITEITADKATERAPSAISQLLTQNPLLEITFPAFGIRENSTETFEQHLNAIQYWVILDVDPTSVSTLSAYDAAGNLTTISSEFDDLINYGVIKLDEAHDAVQNGSTTTLKGKAVPNSISLFEPDEIIGNFKIYNEGTWSSAAIKDMPVVMGNIPALSVDGQGWPETGCERDVQKKDNLFKVKICDWEAARSIERKWDLPKVEIQCTYIFATLLTPPTSTTEGSYSLSTLIFLINHNWKDLQPSSANAWDMPVFINKEVKTWKLSQEAQEWKTIWVEKDGGTTTTLNVRISPTFKINDKISLGVSSSLPIPIGSKDDLMGEVIIEYCDKAADDGDDYLIN